MHPNARAENKKMIFLGHGASGPLFLGAAVIDDRSLGRGSADDHSQVPDPTQELTTAPNRLAWQRNTRHIRPKPLRYKEILDTACKSGSTPAAHRA